MAKQSAGDENPDEYVIMCVLYVATTQVLKLTFLKFPAIFFSSQFEQTLLKRALDRLCTIQLSSLSSVKKLKRNVNK